MAINQAFDRTAMSAAEAQLARVDAQGSSDHPYRRALLDRQRPQQPRATWPTRSISSARFTAATPASSSWPSTIARPARCATGCAKRPTPMSASGFTSSA